MRLERVRSSSVSAGSVYEIVLLCRLPTGPVLRDVGARDGCARSTVSSSGPLARIPTATATAAVAGVGRSTKRVEIGSDVSRVGIGHTRLGHGGSR